jgi:hypothetical protein
MENEKPPILNQSSLIPLGVAVSVLFAIGTAVFYIAGVVSDVNALKAQHTVIQSDLVSTSLRVNALERSQSTLEADLRYITKSLDAIKEKLNIVP